jgi:hypothetical protein
METKPARQRGPTTMNVLPLINGGVDRRLLACHSRVIEPIATTDRLTLREWVAGDAHNTSPES